MKLGPDVTLLYTPLTHLNVYSQTTGTATHGLCV